MRRYEETSWAKFDVGTATRSKYSLWRPLKMALQVQAGLAAEVDACRRWKEGEEQLQEQPIHLLWSETLTSVVLSIFAAAEILLKCGCGTAWRERTDETLRSSF